MITKTLDLGCGAFPRNPYNASELYGIDVREDLDKNIYNVDLVVEPLPFSDNFFNYITAFDFIEHIPRLVYTPTRLYPFVNLMNEIYRTLEVNGKFLSFTPAYPKPEAFRDPTHVNIITTETFPMYFSGINPLAAMYGFNGKFKLESQKWSGPHLITEMSKYE